MHKMHRFLRVPLSSLTPPNIREKYTRYLFNKVNVDEFVQYNIYYALDVAKRSKVSKINSKFNFIFSGAITAANKCNLLDLLANKSARSARD
jgi:hypothetical protein